MLFYVQTEFFPAVKVAEKCVFYRKNGFFADFSGFFLQKKFVLIKKSLEK